MQRNPRSPRVGYLRAGTLAAIGAMAAALSLAVAAPGPVAASASASTPASARSAVSATASSATGGGATTSGKVTCAKRPSVTPPPLGVLKRAAAPGHANQPVPAAPTLKAVCPLGKVPVVKGLSEQLSRASLDQARHRVLSGSRAATTATTAKAAHLPTATEALTCDGTFEQGACYYWASASDLRADHGGGLTMKIEKPSVVKTSAVGAGHSLEEMSVQAGKQFGNIVEIGSMVLSDETDPQLFVFHWVNGAATCYDQCGYQQYSNTYYPGMDLSALVGKSVYSGYVYYKGRWWAWFNGQWLGYFSGSLWKGNFQASQEVQWFGEVAATAFPPRTKMGNGLFAGNSAAAPMSTLCDVNVAAWRCYYYNQQTLFVSDAKFYTIKHTGFGAVRLGGPGT
jgi:hypothetical protein